MIKLGPEGALPKCVHGHLEIKTMTAPNWTGSQMGHYPAHFPDNTLHVMRMLQFAGVDGRQGFAFVLRSELCKQFHCGHLKILDDDARSKGNMNIPKGWTVVCVCVRRKIHNAEDDEDSYGANPNNSSGDEGDI